VKTKTYQDLIAWQRAMDLTQAVYSATSNFPKHEMFGITSQMRRASVSIASNIAEGHGRATDRHFALFLTQARGSLYELETQIQISAGLQYLSPGQKESLMAQAGELGRILNGLLRSLRD